jgi:hypothetical protein
MSNIVKLDDYRNKGNGAREAVMICFGASPLVLPSDNLGATILTDWFLAKLWTEGFKIVPLTPDDESTA